MRRVRLADAAAMPSYGHSTLKDIRGGKSAHCSHLRKLVLDMAMAVPGQSTCQRPWLFTCWKGDNLVSVQLQVPLSQEGLEKPLCGLQPFGESQ